MYEYILSQIVTIIKYRHVIRMTHIPLLRIGYNLLAREYRLQLRLFKLNQGCERTILL